MAGIQLLEWGDFAITAGTDLHHLRNNEDWNPSPAHHLLEVEVDIIEVAWEGTFDVHGVYADLLAKIAEIAIEDEKVDFNSEKILLNESDVTNEGRRTWELFH